MTAWILSAKQRMSGRKKCRVLKYTFVKACLKLQKDCQKRIFGKVGVKFDESALNYFYSSDHIKGEDLAFVGRYFKNMTFKRLLDVASAAGHFAKIFSAEEKIITDMSINMLKTARDKNRFYNLVRCDAQNLPFRDGVFDIVGCRIAMHHFKKPSGFFLEAHRVLKKDGYFVLIDSIVDIDDKYLNKIEKIRDKTHIKSCTVKEIIDFSGMFRLITFHTIFKEHNFEEWAKRLNPMQNEFEEIRQAFFDLPKSMKEELKVKIKDGKIISYTDKKGIFIFRKVR